MSKSEYSISEITRIIKGELILESDTNTMISELAIDSRRLIVPEVSIFFALTSKRNDGHKYIEELYEKGVRNFVVENEPSNLLLLYNTNIIKVKNTLKGFTPLTGQKRSSLKASMKR